MKQSIAEFMEVNLALVQRAVYHGFRDFTPYEMAILRSITSRPFPSATSSVWSPLQSLMMDVMQDIMLREDLRCLLHIHEAYPYLGSHLVQEDEPCLIQSAATTRR